MKKRSDERRLKRLYRQLSRYMDDYKKPGAVNVIRQIYALEKEMNVPESKRINIIV